MTLFFAEGSDTTELSDQQLQQALVATYRSLGNKERVMIVPPDYTRLHSRAGRLTCMSYDHYGKAIVDVLPALGTHKPMTTTQLNDMYPGLPHRLVREHRWRSDVVTVGEVPGEFVRQATENAWTEPWPAQMNKRIWAGGHDLVVSIGQVVPHEVMGMANYNKNIFIGTGGERSINESHFIGAVYGMERMMGRADTPLRRILNQAQDQFCQDLPMLFVLTVVGTNDRGELVTRGLYIGDDVECFELAADISLQVNFTQLDQPMGKVVVTLPPDEFRTTWLGNKAIYRTRMAMKDGGELIILGPGISGFGEDPTIDKLIQKYGYRTTPEIMQHVSHEDDLRSNLSTAAHLIHGSTEGRFRVTYCPGGLSRSEVEAVGYEYGSLAEAAARFPHETLEEGWNHSVSEGEFYYISNPALGLWALKSQFAS